MKKKLIAFFVSLVVITNVFALISFAGETGTVSIELDKSNANVGEIIKATVKVDKIPNLLSFQVNIAFDLSVLQAVDPNTGDPFTEKTKPKNGTILVNEDEYSIIEVASNIVKPDSNVGIINFGRTYINTADYIKSGKGESSGVLGVIGFKVLKKAKTDIRFEKTATIPNSKNGILLSDWNAKAIEADTGYKVVQPATINASSPANTNTTTGEIIVKVDGVQMVFKDAKPFVNKESRTMVPIRFISEALGATVNWDGKEKKVEINYNTRKIIIKIGESKATVNGEVKVLDTKASVVSGRTFVPLRFISESFGNKVEWEGKTKTINIYTK
ncbi:MAG: stalk domain-containing protein [Clostridia bacterium]|nr:stalk domain-containing protein [Clostridia bacterium]